MMICLCNVYEIVLFACVPINFCFVCYRGDGRGGRLFLFCLHLLLNESATGTASDSADSVVLFEMMIFLSRKEGNNFCTHRQTHTHDLQIYTAIE